MAQFQREPGKEIYEEAIFGKSHSQFREMIAWLRERNSFVIYGNLTGIWEETGDFFKGKGRILKKWNGSYFNSEIYIIFDEGHLGKENILIGRRIVEIKSYEKIEPFLPFKELNKTRFPFIKRKQQKFERLTPVTYNLRNSLKRDPDSKMFFRAQDYDQALNWLSSYAKKYNISCHIEGILNSKKKQMPCILTGTIEDVKEKDIFIKIWDAYNPMNPLDDEAKEFLTKDWLIQVGQLGINKVYPRFMLFELGEELSLTKKVLDVKDVKVTLDGRVIIDEVNFELNKGEILGIIGESGAGKSTTLKAILGEFPYEGNIHVFGINAQKTKNIAPFIGYVPQDLSRMYQKFNLLENIVAFGRQYGIPDDILIQRGKKILEDLNIEHVANQTVENLSGGQKRRASIAIAMVHNPQLIFLDEPTSGLDPLARYELWEYMDIINKEYGITLCVISHYLDEIEYCDKACIFLRGIGFYDVNTPEGLKNTLPGKGLALEVTLEDVSIEAVNIIQRIEDVKFVIQRGERIRVLSDLPSKELSHRIIKALNEAMIQIHSIEYKVEIDMVDYFSFVTVSEEERRKEKTENLDLKKIRKEIHSKTKQLNNGFIFDSFGENPDVAFKISSKFDRTKVSKEDIDEIRILEAEKKTKEEVSKED